MFHTDAEWEAAFTAWEKQVEGFARFRGHLADSAWR